MLEQSTAALAEASTIERELAEMIALRYLASELEEDLIPADKALGMAQAHREAGDETWRRAVFGILLGIRSAEAQGYRVQARR